MGIFTDGFKELKKADQPLYKAPKSIQETIDIKKVALDGVFELGGNRYSKSYRFSDINYTTTTEAEQEEILEKYCKFLNSMDCSFKITLNNKNRDMNRLKDTVLIKRRNDKFDKDVQMYNDLIEEKIQAGRRGTLEEMYLTICIERKNFEEAVIQFASIENTIHKAFSELGADIAALNGNERIRILHDFYHLGSEDGFTFDLKHAANVGEDFKNDLVGGMVKYFPDHIEDDGKYVRALFIKKYPNSLSDRFLNELTSLPIHSVTSIDIVPIPKDLTTRVLQNKYMGIESDIIKQQRVRNRNNDFSSDISYSKRMEKKDIEAIMDDVRENDQRLFFVSVIILVVGRDMKELDSITESIQTIGKRHSVTIDTHYLKQREAMNTALPIGVRQVETMRTLLTQCAAVMVPFNVQELNDPSGVYYGINQISKNVNIANRKNLMNGNGFVLGATGSGKSTQVKDEMMQVILRTGDDIIVIDPMGEYAVIAEHFDGTIINLSAYTRNYVNPLDADLEDMNENGLRDVVADKAQFMLSVFDQLLGDSLNQKHRSIVDRCMRELYMEAYSTKQIPLMTDFYNILKKQDEMEAQELALYLELFVEGTLNIFNHHTNVDVDNRFIVYCIQDLGSQLAPIGMLVMMEAIQSRIIANSRKGRATWLYIDEAHVLLNSDYSAKYLQQLWKKVRKQGGLCTGISQNVTDLMQNYVAATLISNSEFIVLMKQSSIDSNKMSEAIGISNAQLRYVSNCPVGTGLIKCGNTVIPFDNTLDKDSELYRMINTNIHEKIEMGLFDNVEESEDTAESDSDTFTEFDTVSFDEYKGDQAGDTAEADDMLEVETGDDASDHSDEDIKIYTVKHRQDNPTVNSWLIY